MKIYDLIKGMFWGRESKSEVIHQHFDTEASGQPVTHLIVRGQGRRAVTVQGRLIRLWEIDSSSSYLLASAEADHLILFVADDHKSQEWITFCKTELGLACPSYLAFRCWDTLGVKRRIQLPDGLTLPQCIVVAPNGAMMAVAGHDGQLLLYDRSSGNLLDRSKEQAAGIGGASFSPDGGLLAAAFVDQGGGDVLIFDVSRGKLDIQHESIVERSLPNVDLADAWVQTVFSPDGTCLVVYEGQQALLALFRMPEARLEWTRAMDFPATSSESIDRGEIEYYDTIPAFPTDGKWLYVGSTNGIVMVLSTIDGAEMTRLKMPGNGFVHRVIVDEMTQRLWSVNGMIPMSIAMPSRESSTTHD